MRPRSNSNGYEILRVTYANGDTEDFPEAVTAQTDVTGALLLPRNGNYDRAVIATIPISGLRKWEWVPER